MFTSARLLLVAFVLLGICAIVGVVGLLPWCDPNTGTCGGLGRSGELLGLPFVAPLYMAACILLLMGTWHRRDGWQLLALLFVASVFFLSTFRVWFPDLGGYEIDVPSGLTFEEMLAQHNALAAASGIRVRQPHLDRLALWLIAFAVGVIAALVRASILHARDAAAAPATLERHPYLADAAIFGLPINAYGFKVRPQRRNSARAILAVHEALGYAALVERHKRGYGVRTDTGQLQLPPFDPRYGWEVERKDNPDGSATVIFAHDALRWSRGGDGRQRTTGKGLKYQASVATGRELEQVQAAGIHARSSRWLDQYDAAPLNLHQGLIPLFHPALKAVHIAPTNPSPLAPLSTEKGGAAFHWPAEWARS